MADRQHLDKLGVAELFDQLVHTFNSRVRGDENQLVGLEAVCTLHGFFELLKVLSHSGDDDSNIFRCDGGFVDRLNGLIRPIACKIDPKSEVSEEAESASQLLNSEREEQHGGRVWHEHMNLQECYENTEPGPIGEQAEGKGKHGDDQRAW